MVVVKVMMVAMMVIIMVMRIGDNEDCYGDQMYDSNHDDSLDDVIAGGGETKADLGDVDSIGDDSNDGGGIGNVGGGDYKCGNDANHG